ncbi:hypothetical protein B0T22DRAFT_477333 [Podospora appendiculata]|uniref:Uncharacterized protein n=1 Tax=Podospora appendiculata TaxID=314037 RepID=A0AAE0XJI9_9PEZI|nr:hypothetical protein B0T22DRAFT_477333 [Podospora appendiculata]
MGWVLFETTESVIEVLWDIALAFWIVRIGFIYFALNFLSGIFITYLTYTQMAPVSYLTTPQSGLYLMPFLFVSAALWARYIIVAYEIPRSATFRLAIGATGLVFTVLAEGLVGLVLYEEGLGRWILDVDRQAGIIFAALLLGYAVMPALQMAVESKQEPYGETKHGHEKKKVVDAVPTVNVSEKTEKKNQ